MASGVVKFYFGVQNFPKGRAGKNYVQAKCQSTSVNFVNEAFFSAGGLKNWLQGDRFLIFAKNYLLKMRTKLKNK
jgi:hypothetical protein